MTIPCNTEALESSERVRTLGRAARPEEADTAEIPAAYSVATSTNLSRSTDANVIGRQQLCNRGGCSSKLSGTALRHLLTGATGTPDDALPPFEDAAGFTVPFASDGLATIDFGPLACSDPRAAGRIAALNALSDLYATGSTPAFALAILIIDPSASLPFAEQLLAGILQACGEDGVPVIGGQTTTGPEFVAGLAAVGFPTAKRLTKQGAQPGDAIMLSKPLGSNLIIWAHLLGLVSDEDLEGAMTASLTSNRAASRIVVSHDAHACTDVTGFGLLGHLSEMLRDGRGAILDFSRIPLQPALAILPESVKATAATGANRQYVARTHDVRVDVDRVLALPLFDAQTNGGLLVAVDPRNRESFELNGFFCMGQITEGEVIHVR